MADPGLKGIIFSSGTFHMKLQSVAGKRVAQVSLVGPSPETQTWMIVKQWIDSNTAWGMVKEIQQGICSRDKVN